MRKPTQKEIDGAREFVATPRGQLIIGQALAVASEALKNSEPSNSDDMKFIGENLFSVFYHLYSPDMQAQMRKNEQEVAKMNKKNNQQSAQ